jgi:hypothetical protein
MRDGLKEVEERAARFREVAAAHLKGADTLARKGRSVHDTER